MNASIGQSGILLGLLACLGGIATVVTALVRGRTTRLTAVRPYVWMLLLGAVVAFVAMERALLTHDFSLQYVVDNHARATPTLYTIASLWGALEGSILLWGLVLAGYLAAMTFRFRRRSTDPVVAWATVVGLGVAAFFFALLMGPANPFRGVEGVVPFDGDGPNPLLQDHPLMAVHPPMLYLGYVGMTVPFAFGLAALITGRVGEAWMVETRRWTLVAWGFLTSGILLGAWWSYEVLGWGGYWAWDPVENASLLPWLTATAYLHSTMVQERRGMLRVWNLALILSTFSLTILGTFLTRSGVLDSVHAFSESPIGPILLGFFGVVTLTMLGLIAWRGDRLRTDGVADSPVSREGAILGSNLLLAGFTIVVLLGTVFPLLAEALRGERLSVGRPYFDRMATPLALGLLFLMAVGPALPWRRASGELVRSRLQVPAWVGALAMAACAAAGVRGVAPIVAFGLGGFAGAAAVRQLVLAARRQGPRALLGRTGGGMIVHVGVVVLAVAFAASSSYAVRREVRLREGESAVVAGHRITFEGTASKTYPTRAALEAYVDVDGERHVPALSRYARMAQAVGTPSVRSTLTEDVYITLVNAPKDGGPATIGVVVTPLVVWLWIGGGIMALGTLLALMPSRRRRPVVSTTVAEDAVAVASPADASATSAGPDAGEREPQPVATS